MKKRRLGKSGLKVSAIGMGCMGFSHGYGAVPSEGESIRLMRKAYDEYGCTLFDTAEVYATYANEELVGKALKPIRDNVILTTKFMPVFLAGQEIPEGKLSRKGLRNALESSLKRLQTEYIDLYYEHRVPENSDPAEVAFWMGELIQEGKIRAWGQSEPTAEQIRIAHAVTPLAAVQNEYSFMQRRPEQEVLATCEELGIGFEAYSPMGGGFLSGKYDKDTKFTGDDVRRVITRYNRENMEANQPLLDLLRAYAAEKQATPAQLALAWLLHKKDFIVPIPGMRKDERLAENFGAADVALSPEELAGIDKALGKIAIHGDRKDSDIVKLGTVQSVILE
ncbi:MAG: aldo/keto reductase [Desulfovibrio sp.]|uniref:aldo/keto reductase n=1 Tax=Desulfovibrio sp. TaxID=885 RepID=UPI0025BF280C|nr:aldo/keto reductase [Desulfovibrio sp.]MBS6829858.1 aldo/keto reductase [Desulfovibrio sp.]